MESNNSNNDNYGEEEPQLGESARKRKSSELANDGHGQPATAEDGEQKQHQPPEKLSIKNCRGQQGDNALKNLDLESLTREDLIHLVQRQLASQNEAHKQLEAVKKEAEENAKEQAMALLASQQKVEELTGEMANHLNVEHQQKYLDSAKQAEDFSQRNIKLEQEKAEVQAKLDQKMAVIEDMHKEVEEKSEELAEKAKQIDALLVQLNESIREQHHLHTDQQMKIQLSLETWYDLLAFVPRPRLGKIVPKIGDRKFASIVQKFLHDYKEIELDDIQIVAPYEEEPDGHPRVRVLQNDPPLRFEMAEAQMPANIKNFWLFELRYFDQSVLNFMQKFQQNGLLDNVTLLFDNLSVKDIVQTILCHLLPLINGIRSIRVEESAQLVDLYDAGKSKEIYEMKMKMMEKTRALCTRYDPENLHANTIDLYCRWLYQTARADGKPRVLYFGRMDVDSAPVSLFIDRIKQDFLMATDPVTFFIRINLPKAFETLESICLENDKTKERLLTKMIEEKWEVVLQITRYPLTATKKWIVENEKEVLNWEFGADKTIYLSG